ncbi:MAG TPA: 2-phosphosulfolactate phosphatase [Pseudonocardia sp.]
MVVEPRAEHRQRAYDVRCEWGEHGLELLARDCAVVVIVDVLSFCTAVDIAVGRGARVLPQRCADAATGKGQVAPSSAARREAAALGALAAGPRDGTGPSLRPSSLLRLVPTTLLALPSPNGATLCSIAGLHSAVVLAGCLRNASAVAAAARQVRCPIGLVAAGERWPDGTLRVAAEDALGVGAIATALQQGDTAATRSEQGHAPGTRDRPTLSPEARLVAAQFAAASRNGLLAVLCELASGRELIADGYGDDVRLAADLDVSAAVPRLIDGVLRG